MPSKFDGDMINILSFSFFKRAILNFPSVTKGESVHSNFFNLVPEVYFLQVLKLAKIMHYVIGPTLHHLYPDKK